MKKFTYETKRPCGKCKRPVDAVRQPGTPGLLVSRHLARGASGFCAGSLAEAKSSAEAPR